MHYELKDQVAFISIDDGKANAVGHSFVDGLNQYLEQAEREASAVVLHGRTGVFSAGFDLKELGKGAKEADILVGKGMLLLERLYAFPKPLISICDGHAIGMGAFILLASDTRIGSVSDYKISLPETSIGMPFNDTLMSVVQARVSPLYKVIAALQSYVFTPKEAVTAGFLDNVVDAEQLMPMALKIAQDLIKLPAAQYKINKLHLREGELKIMRTSLGL
jgi:enoyl-CoA hydratase